MDFRLKSWTKTKSPYNLWQSQFKPLSHATLYIKNKSNALMQLNFEINFCGMLNNPFGKNSKYKTHILKITCSNHNANFTQVFSLDGKSQWFLARINAHAK